MTLSTPTTDGGRVDSFCHASTGFNVLHAQTYDASGQKVGAEPTWGEVALGPDAGNNVIFSFPGAGHRGTPACKTAPMLGAPKRGRRIDPAPCLQLQRSTTKGAGETS